MFLDYHSIQMMDQIHSMKKYRNLVSAKSIHLQKKIEVCKTPGITVEEELYEKDTKQ